MKLEIIFKFNPTSKGNIEDQWPIAKDKITVIKNFSYLNFNELNFVFESNFKIIGSKKILWINL